MDKCAQRIDCDIEYRTKQGKFNCKEDIMKINGIKEAAYSKIKDYITV